MKKIQRAPTHRRLKLSYTVLRPFRHFPEAAPFFFPPFAVLRSFNGGQVPKIYDSSVVEQFQKHQLVRILPGYFGPMDEVLSPSVTTDRVQRTIHCLRIVETVAKTRPCQTGDDLRSVLDVLENETVLRVSLDP